MRSYLNHTTFGHSGAQGNTQNNNSSAWRPCWRSQCNFSSFIWLPCWSLSREFNPNVQICSSLKNTTWHSLRMPTPLSWTQRPAVSMETLPFPPVWPPHRCWQLHVSVTWEVIKFPVRVKWALAVLWALCVYTHTKAHFITLLLPLSLKYLQQSQSHTGNQSKHKQQTGSEKWNAVLNWRLGQNHTLCAKIQKSTLFTHLVSIRGLSKLIKQIF